MSTKEKKQATEPEHLYEYRGNVVSIYDGDTMRLDIDLGFDVWLHNVSVRLLGINAPELRGAERHAGLKSRDALRMIMMRGNDEALIRTTKDKKGKYGRWLAEVFIWNGDTWESVNEMLVNQGLAVRAVY